MMRRTRAWMATGVVSLLATSGIVLASPANAEADCEGMAAQQSLHPGNQAPTPQNDVTVALAGGTRSINVLRNDTDPENDHLYVVSAGRPDHGETCIDSDGTIEYSAASSATNYTDTFTYGVTDGDLFRTATVTVKVTGIKPLRAQLVHRKHGKKKAQVRFTNPNNRNMVVFAGEPKKERPLLTRTITPGKTVGFKTKAKRVIFLAFVRDIDGGTILVDLGILNTKTGAQSISSGDEEDFFRTHPGTRSLQREWTRK